MAFKKYFQGDIVLVPFPFSDAVNTKTRPAIVVSNKSINGSQDVILAAITSNIRNDKFSYELEDHKVDTSLGLQSEIRCNKVFTMEKSIIKKRISKLKAEHCCEIFAKISENYSCD
jgi:mRNA interferase MazF